MNDWGIFEKFLGYLRYFIVNKYIKPGDVIVDIGCGRKQAFLYSNKSKFKKGYGFDFRIEDRIDDNIVLINNKGMDIFPINDSEVDKVFLNAVLEHLENPERVLSEAFRILKSGGCIIMTTPTRIAKPVLEFLSFRLKIIDPEEILEHKHYYNKADIEELIIKTGNLSTLEKYRLWELGFNSLIILRKK